MPSTLSNIIAEFRLAADIVSGGLKGNVTRRYTAGNIVIGAAAGQVGLLYDEDIVIATGVPLDIDLTATFDPAGNPIRFGKLTHWGLFNLSTTVGEDLTAGGGANPVFAALPFPAAANGGALIVAIPYNGITIDATHKTFRVAAAAGAAVNAQLMMFGRV